MTGGIRVDLEPFCSMRVIRRLQQRGTQRHGFLVRSLEIVDMYVEMDLLRRPIGPLGPNKVRCELNAEPPFAIDQNAVPIVVRYNSPTQQSGPERALGKQVGGIEDDDLSLDSHPVIVPQS